MGILEKWSRYKQDKTVFGDYDTARDYLELFKTNLTYKQAEILNHILRKQVILALVLMAMGFILGALLGWGITDAIYRLKEALI